MRPARLFGDVRAGKVRILIGSSETMGTRVNAQLRLKALHHLNVPWLPSQIEQREGRIVRQSNQHDVVDIIAYATEGSLDAQMWQQNERKARFIAAALEADIARLERLRAAHMDDRHAVRRHIRDAERDIEFSMRRIAEIGQDIERLVPTVGDAFAMSVMGKRFAERKDAGRALMKEILTLVQLQQEGEAVIAEIEKSLALILKERGCRARPRRRCRRRANEFRPGFRDGLHDMSRLHENSSE